MGTYTRLHISILLRKDTPDSVTALLERVVTNKDFGAPGPVFNHGDIPRPDINIYPHPFFDCERWYMMLIANDFDPKLGSTFKKGEFGRWWLVIETDFKNYDDEIRKFVNWISPYAASSKKKQCIGWYCIDADKVRNNIYVERNTALM